MTVQNIMILFERLRTLIHTLWPYFWLIYNFWMAGVFVQGQSPHLLISPLRPIPLKWDLNEINFTGNQMNHITRQSLPEMSNPAQSRTCKKTENEKQA